MDRYEKCATGAKQVYLAGPDVFLPNAREHAARKVAICARYGLEGRPPLNDEVEDLTSLPFDVAWRKIFKKDIELMQASQLGIFNLTPFGGASADSGTLVELGWFLGQGKPIFAYSNSTVPFDQRMREYVRAFPHPIEGLTVEGFGLADNLMIAGAVESGGHGILLPRDGEDHPLDSLEVFEACVRIAAEVTAICVNQSQ
jgi:nucleoside 2-deoxyribosyltransferase